MNIVILGSGNVAHVLGRKILQAGHTIVQVFARQPEKARSLAGLLQAEPVSDLGLLDAGANLYLVAVADGAIPAIAGELKGWGRPVAHTAGSVSREALAATGAQYGVLYPLQSLRKEMDYLPEIPFLVDGSTREMQQLVEQLALSLSPKVQVAGDAERLRLHLAAVVVSNFTNHLFALAEQYCREEQADFSLLLPLIGEVTHRLQVASPAETQTGPAIRHDRQTIQHHLALLEGHPVLKKFYEQFSASIEKFHG